MKDTCQFKNKFSTQNMFTSNTLLLFTSDSKYMQVYSKQLSNKAGLRLRLHKNTLCS